MEKELIKIDNIEDFIGRIVYVQPFSNLKVSSWVIMISSVNENIIRRFMSYSLRTKKINIDEEGLSIWGTKDFHSFYVAPEEYQEMFKEALKKENLKYVKVLNRLIKR